MEHFYYSREETLIATQDASFTKVLGKTKFFATYENLRDSFEAALREGKPIDMETAKGISSTDILSRIFCLTDVTTNPGNYGRAMIDEGKTKWKLIDFRLETRTGSYIIPDIFEGLRKGNGMYNYIGFLGHLLRDRPENERIETAIQVVADLESGKPRQSRAGMKMPLLEAINKVFCEMVQYIKQDATKLGIALRATLGDLEQTPEDMLISQLNELSIHNPSDYEKLGDLGRYAKAVCENFAALADGVKARHTELLASTITPGY